jgi:large subunit ribosomal protein L30
MKVIIRITGDVNLRKDVRETLRRLRLRKKYSCVVLKDTKVNLGMIKKIHDYVAYGEIQKVVLEKLIEKRAKLIDKTKKIDFKKVAESIEKGEKFEKLNIKPFFGLHPPRGGIDCKKHFGVNKGVLGNNKEHINKLIERML